jgi:KaiC/GvpD/RAD55 family RecA-like ATPase
MDQEPATVNNVVEIREIESTPLGIGKLDSIFSGKVPRICNIVFSGPIGSDSLHTSLQIMLNKAKDGEPSLYISFHNSEEKILNFLKTMDSNILNFLNRGTIMVKRLNPFEMANIYCKSPNEQDRIKKFLDQFKFVEEFKPGTVVVDSLSSLQLAFPNDKLVYRDYLDNLFHYFENLGIMAIFIREFALQEAAEEFYEDIIADSVLYFDKGSIKPIKRFVLAQKKKNLFANMFGL